jgi:hypothetical protein
MANANFFYEDESIMPGAIITITESDKTGDGAWIPERLPVYPHYEPAEPINIIYTGNPYPTIWPTCPVCQRQLPWLGPCKCRRKARHIMKIRRP